jgi:cell division protein ZapA (FtsZ GTPase activity inhibitor)
MKQKYTIRISDIEINVISEESPEAVEALVSLVDRKMRDVLAGARCSKTDAALLCALDYCSERIKAQRRIKTLESKLMLAESTVEELEMENEKLRAQLPGMGGIL